jgi:riboflavin synthase
MIVSKGSIAIDGVSLTIAATDAECFSVALIPTTLERTTLDRLEAGRRVNIESDIIARTVSHQLGRMCGTNGPGDLAALLHRSGFA